MISNINEKKKVFENLYSLSLSLTITQSKIFLNGRPQNRNFRNVSCDVYVVCALCLQSKFLARCGKVYIIIYASNTTISTNSPTMNQITRDTGFECSVMIRRFESSS